MAREGISCVKRRAYETLGRLYAAYHEYNIQHFASMLVTLPIYIRPTTGQVTIAYTWTDDYTGAPRYIVLTEAHALGDPWLEVKETLLHEMVHVWQAQQGRKVGHDESFRLMAERLGISGRACD